MTTQYKKKLKYNATPHVIANKVPQLHWHLKRMGDNTCLPHYYKSMNTSLSTEVLTAEIKFVLDIAPCRLLSDTSTPSTFTAKHDKGSKFPKTVIPMCQIS
jgi:hypothetical protein